MASIPEFLTQALQAQYGETLGGADPGGLCMRAAGYPCGSIP